MGRDAEQEVISARLRQADHGGLRGVQSAHRGRLCLGQARGFSRSRPLASRALGRSYVPTPRMISPQPAVLRILASEAAVGLAKASARTEILLLEMEHRTLSHGQAYPE